MKNRVLYLVALFMGLIILIALLKLPFLAFHLPVSAGYGWGDWWNVIRHGYALDQTVAGYLIVLPLLFSWVSIWLPCSTSLWRKSLLIYGGLISVVAAAIYAVDFVLYGYWGFRIDSSLLLYLKSPKEAMASLSMADWMWGGGAFLLFFGLFFSLFFLCGKIFKSERIALLQKWLGSGLMLLAAGLCFLAIRGGLSVAVANVSKVYFSADTRLNHAAINPLFSLLSTLGDDKDMKPQYLFFEEEERAARFEALRGDRPDQGDTPQLLTTRRPNVVIILLESFSRNFLDAEVDGRPVLPYLRSLREKGIWFENCIANSYRTDRGQVAVLNGYPAQTRMSIMKYPAKSQTLPSIARSLGKVGYTTWFTYGGDLNFTDQASCMYATGWQRLSWQKDFDFDAPTSKWGYADDVMADYLGDQLLLLDAESRKTNQPFLAGWLTLSSHEPFEVPCQLFEDKELNGMAFTDRCVGKLIERLKGSPAWENLLVVLVADHGYPWPQGTAYNSLARHRIPLLWLGGAVREPQVVTSYCGQIDLAATLLVQLGLPHDDFLFSRDIFSEQTPKFGYWCFNDGFGVVNEEATVIYDCASDRLVEGSDTTLLHYGKVLLQTTYKDIRER